MSLKIKSAIAMVLALGLTASVFTGCAEPGKAKDPSEGTSGLSMKLDGKKSEEDKTLTTFITFEAPPAFNGNPYDSAGINWSLQPLLYDNLADYSAFPEQTFKESLLESYKLEDKVLTMKLKSGLKWSDGSALTAEDVMTNYYVNVGKSAIWTYAEKIEQVDELTVKITFATESPLLLRVAFTLPIMSPTSVYGKWAEQYKVIAETGRTFNEKTKTYGFSKESTEKLTAINNDLLAYKPDAKEIVTSGAYVIDGVTTSEITFKKNPNYRIDVAMETVRGVKSGGAEAYATSILEGTFTLENGGLSIDTAKQVDQRYADTMRKLFIPEMSQIGFAFNYQKYPVSIPEVRKAISMATDRSTLVAIAEPGSFLSDTRNSGLIPSLTENYTNKGFMDKLTDYKYNTDEAAKLLESIGWSKNSEGLWQDEKGEVITLEIATISSWPSFMLPSEAMSTMLTEFGFKVDFKPMESGTIWTYLGSSDFMIGSTFLGGASTYAHPWEAFNGIFASPRIGLPALEPGQERIVKAPTTGKEYNVTQMLTELFQATDESKIKSLTEEFMTLLNDLSIFMPVIEKTTPLRVYDTTLSLAEGKLNEIQKNFYYFGNLNTMIMKMQKEGLLYFVEESK